jgi:hypothetical protein
MIHRIAVSAFVIAWLAKAQEFKPAVPRAWDDHEVAGFEVPLAQAGRSPRYLSEAEYYALEVPPIYRGYPVYAAGKAPPGYLESLRQKEPEIIFDATRLRSREDWIRAGEIVFRADRSFIPAETAIPTIVEGAFRALNIPTTPDGIIPYVQFVVRRKGVVEYGTDACSVCHTRVLPDRTVWPGAQGNIPAARRAAWVQSHDPRPNLDQILSKQELVSFGAPWVGNAGELYASSLAEFVRRFNAMQPGVFAREGTGSAYPAHVPSLIGIKDIRYLDATGLTRHRSIGDLMRYSIVNQGFGEGLQMSAHYGDYQPVQASRQRFSDEQLYALALYLYSLEAPPNPNRFDDAARRGQRVFEQSGCAGCHTPPLYTNNKLAPVQGFRVPDKLRETDQILDVSVGTDSGLAMKTRRGTGFYKVPSLRGVWYRNAFGHNGQAETLEDWLDPARLRDDYVPKGFHLGPGPIKGHEFGLKLPVEDRNALIAFLKTL